MRISDRGAAAALLLLAGCGERTSEGNTLPEVDPAQAAAAADAGTVPCARGAEALAPVCTVDQATSDRGLVITVRHPDGGFRRLLVTRDGRGVVAADGAEPARVTLSEPGMIDVSVGGDRYRLPATVKPAK